MSASLGSGMKSGGSTKSERPGATDMMQRSEPSDLALGDRSSLSGCFACSLDDLPTPVAVGLDFGTTITLITILTAFPNSAVGTAIAGRFREKGWPRAACSATTVYSTYTSPFTAVNRSPCSPCRVDLSV